MIKKKNCFITFKDWKCNIEYSKYPDDRWKICLIDMEDGITVATATIFLGTITLLNNEVIIKDYSENEGIYDVLIKNGIINRTPKAVKLSEFVTAPICTINYNSEFFIEKLY